MNTKTTTICPTKEGIQFVATWIRKNKVWAETFKIKDGIIKIWNSKYDYFMVDDKISEFESYEDFFERMNDITFTIVIDSCQEKIDTILRCFNFREMHKIMEFLNWSWDHHGYIHVPSLIELHDEAERLLNNVYNYCEEDHEDQQLETGGFIAIAKYDEDKNEIILRLIFSVTEWED